jgi:hypothetical protein
MSSKFSKNSVDINLLLVNVSIILKSGKELNFKTKATETMEFVDCLINNPAIQETDRLSAYFQGRYYVFNDYRKSKSILINLDDVSGFTIPFFKDIDNKYWQYQEIRKV